MKQSEDLEAVYPPHWSAWIALTLLLVGFAIGAGVFMTQPMATTGSNAGLITMVTTLALLGGGVRALVADAFHCGYRLGGKRACDNITQRLGHMKSDVVAAVRREF